MSNILNFVSSIGADLKDKITNTIVDLTGTHSHNMIDPSTTNCVVRNPSLPLCSSIPKGSLELGTLITLSGTISSTFGKRSAIACFSCLFSCIKPIPNTNSTVNDYGQQIHNITSSTKQTRLSLVSLTTPRTPSLHSRTRQHKHRNNTTTNNNNNHINNNDKENNNLLDNNNLEIDNVVSSERPKCWHRIIVFLINHRFRIDFIAGKCEHTRDKTEQPVPSNVAFHFNPRFNGGDAAGDVVVMNSRLDNAWGDEQREQSFPFGIQQPFNMMILVEEDSFKIAVNGKHMYEFKHRVPYNSIGCIHIEGDIEINTIEFRKELKYLNSSGSSSSSNNWCDRIKAKLIPSPPVPYTEFDVRLGKEFTMYVAGKLPNICNRFFVLNLAASGNNFPVHTIPFHLSIRPQERVMVRNSFENGDWKSEERSIEGEFPLIPGAHFDMMICNKPDILTVAANGQMVFEFRHRMNPSIIDTVEINGSVELSSVRYEFYE